MPSDLAAGMLGEGKPPKPSELFQNTFPSNGDEPTFKWRLHRVLGVAPTGLNTDSYELFLEWLAECNVDSEHPTNEVTIAQLETIDAGVDAALGQFLNEVRTKARHVGADTVAFTTEL